VLNVINVHREIIFICNLFIFEIKDL